MKKTKRTISLIFALVLTFSIAVIPAAAEDEAARQDPLLAAMMEADDYEEFYTEDGTVKVMTATVPSDLLVTKKPVALGQMMTRSPVVLDNPMDAPITGTAMWNDPGFVFSCRNGLGRNCRLVATNADDSTTLNATYSCVIDGRDVSIDEDIAPNNSRVTLFQSNTTAHLTFSIDIQLSPVRALDVDYEFIAEQY